MKKYNYVHFTLYIIRNQIHHKKYKGLYDKLWEKDLQKKAHYTLREYKHVIHDQQYLYDNSAAATTLFRLRNRTLKLNIERRPTEWTYTL